MQSDTKQLYILTAKRTGKSEQRYKDIGEFVQKELNRKLKEPEAIITKLKGVGFWYLRKQRLQRVLNCYPTYYEIDGYNDFSSEQALFKFIDKQKLYKNFKQRLKEYEDYIALKKAVKIKKDEYKRIHESKTDSTQPSED